MFSKFLESRRVAARELVKEIAPRIAIPMHFRDDEKGFGFDIIGTVAEFAEHMGSVAELDVSTIEVAGQFDCQTLILVS